MRRNLKRAALALSAAVILAGCGTDQEELRGLGAAFKSFANVRKITQKPKQAPAAFSPDMINAQLASNPNPTVYVMIEDRNMQAMIVQIERNGDYRTYASTDRASVTLNKGVLTSTRGLSGDLMSADIHPTLALVSERQTGSASKVLRHLVRDGVTRETRFQCEIGKGPKTEVAWGEVKSKAVVMVETCKSGDLVITNNYAVDPKGEVITSRQWAGPNLGYMLFAQLRM